MILPFLSFTWSAFAGQYAMPFVRILCDVPNMGRFAAPLLNARQKGRRAILFQNAEKMGPLLNHRSDRLQGKYRSLWFDNGIAASAAAFGTLVEQLFAAKGDLDMAVFDIEDGVGPMSFDAEGFEALYADPRYKALAATGKFPADCRNMSVAESKQFASGCGFITDAAIRQGLIAALYKRYNNLAWCNYADSPVTQADSPLVPDLNGHTFYYPPSSATYYTPSLYGYSNLLGRNDARFKQSFYVTAWSLNSVRAAYRGKAGAKVMPWLAPRAMSNVWSQADWQELVFHVCCLCGVNLLYFNAGDTTAIGNWRYDNALSQFIGKARGKVWKSVLTTDLIRYDTATYIYSACKLADGSVVGRVTFKPGTNSATFSVGGKTYTVNRPNGGLGEWFHS